MGVRVSKRASAFASVADNPQAQSNCKSEQIEEEAVGLDGDASGAAAADGAPKKHKKDDKKKKKPQGRVKKECWDESSPQKKEDKTHEAAVDNVVVGSEKAAVPKE